MRNNIVVDRIECLSILLRDDECRINIKKQLDSDFEVILGCLDVIP